jgi:hypothetical protein
MGHSRKIRHRDKLVAATKAPIRAKKLGLRSEGALSKKERVERVERYQRRRLQSDFEFRAMAKRETPRLPLGGTPLEQVAIDAYSTAIAARIVSYLRNAPIEITLIPRGLKHGTRTKVQPRFAPIRITCFAALVDALEQSQARDQT